MIRRPSRVSTALALAGRAALLAAMLAATRSGTVHAATATAPPAVSDSALAVYDGGVVYPHDFTAAWWMLSPPERPPGDALASRKTFLRSVVDRQIVAGEARRHPFTLTLAESLEIERNRNQMIQNALFDDLTKNLKPPTDADVERYRRQKSDLAEIRFAVFTDLQRALSWRSRIANGTPFSDLDKAIARGGAQFATADTFRFVAAEQIPDTLAQLIWSMRPGQVSDVQEFGGQPTLVLLRSFKKRPAPLAAGENMAVRTELQGRQYARVREHFRQELALQVGRTFEDANMQRLLAAHLKIRPRSDVDSVTGQPIIHANLPLPPVDPADTVLVLAHAGSTTVTVGDYLRFWGLVQPYARPEIREMGSLQGAVDRLALAPALLAEAKRRGLDNDSEIAAAVVNMREGDAVDHFYRDMFQDKVKVTDAALHKLWAADPGHYNDRASINPRLLVVDRESLADSLAARIASGASFTELVAQYSVDGATAAKGGLAGKVFAGTQDNSGLERAMFATPVGKWGGPERTPQGWVLWRIEAAEPGVTRSFADARGMLERDFRILEADRLLTAWLDERKRGKHVQYFDERITPTLGRGGPWD